MGGRVGDHYLPVSGRALLGVASMTIPPIKVTICPPAFSAPSTGTLSPTHQAAIRAHNDMLEALYQSTANTRRVPIRYGKKNLPRTAGARFYMNDDFVADIVDDLPDGMAANGL